MESSKIENGAKHHFNEISGKLSELESSGQSRTLALGLIMAPYLPAINEDLLALEADSRISEKNFGPSLQTLLITISILMLLHDASKKSFKDARSNPDQSSFFPGYFEIVGKQIEERENLIKSGYVASLRQLGQDLYGENFMEKFSDQFELNRAFAHYLELLFRNSGLI